MQFLYRGHPEIRMGVELLIKPGRSAFLGSDAQKIGPCIASKRPVPSLMPVVAGATVEWPSPSHVCIIFLSAPKKQERRQVRSARTICSQCQGVPSDVSKAQLGLSS